MVEDKLVFVGQKAFIEKNGKILILYNSRIGLDYPGGKIQAGEYDVVASLQREAKEETGLEVLVGKPFSTWILEFDSQTDKKKTIFFVAYKCKYVSGNVHLSDEHVCYKWISKENYQEVYEASVWFRILEQYFVDK